MIDRIVKIIQDLKEYVVMNSLRASFQDFQESMSVIHKILIHYTVIGTV